MPKRTKQQWLALFKEFEQSGLTVAQFCEANNLNAKYFSNRKYFLGWNKKQEVRPKPKLIKLEKPKVRVTALCVLEIGDAKLQLSSDISVDWLAQLIKALNE